MKTIISLLTIIGICFGAYIYIENRYALSEEVKKIEQRLDYKITSDQIQSKQQRIWGLEDRYPNKSKMPETVKEEYRQLEVDKSVLEKKLEVLEKK